jgi:hypothetical protein
LREGKRSVAGLDYQPAFDISYRRGGWHDGWRGIGFWRRSGSRSWRVYWSLVIDWRRGVCRMCNGAHWVTTLFAEGSPRHVNKSAGCAPGPGSWCRSRRGWSRRADLHAAVFAETGTRGIESTAVGTLSTHGLAARLVLGGDRTGIAGGLGRGGWRAYQVQATVIAKG